MRAWTIVRRDLVASWKGLAVAAGAIVAFGLFLASTVSPPPMDPPTRQALKMVRTPMMGIALLPTLVALGVSASRLYGKDIMEGRTQSLFHYSMSYNEVHAIKSVSSLIPGSLVSLMFCLTVIPILVGGVGLTGGPALQLALTVFGVLMFAAVVIGAWALGLSTLIASATGRLTLAFHRLFMLLFGLSLFATETVLESVGLQILRVLGVITTPQGVADWRELADTLAAASPIHVAGRLLSSATGSSVPLDLHFVVPAAVAALVIGYLFGAREYPDLLLQKVTS